MVDQTADSLAYLQDVFQDSLDPGVVRLILTESNFVVDDALEKLLTISDSVSSSDDCNPNLENKSTTQIGITSRKDFSGCDYLNDGTTVRIEREALFMRDEKSESQANIDICASAELSKQELHFDSTDHHVKSLPCSSSNDFLTNKNSCRKKVNTTASGRDLGNSLPESHKSPDMNDPRLTDSSNGFVQQLKSGNAISNEQSSSNRREMHETASPYTTMKLKDQSKGLPDSRLSQTLNSKEAKESKKLSLKDYRDQNTNLKTVIPQNPPHIDCGIEVTDQPLSSNVLPPWPDSPHGYYQMQPFHGMSHGINQGFHIHHGFPRDQKWRLIRNATHFQYVPQYQPSQSMDPYNPSTYNSNASLVPDVRNQSTGWYPGLNPIQNGYTASRIRNTFQSASGMRKLKGGAQAENRNMQKPVLPNGKVLVILRGLPGSGKTTLARKLKGDGVILSTDDYFIGNGQYQFEGIALAEAHEWNQNRAKNFMERGLSPIVIDNTNTQAWEMRPYALMAQRRGYHVIIMEPDTPWKWNTKELLKRNQHNVPGYGIKKMKERYEKDLTVEKILGSNREEQKRVFPKLESSHSTNVETQNQTSDCIKPIQDKERKFDKQMSPDYSTQKFSSVSDNNKDTSNITMQNQLANMTNNHQTKSSATSPSLVSKHLGNQSDTALQEIKQCQPKPKRGGGRRLEMDTLRSHGSRSPIQDIDFSLSELPQASDTLEVSSKSLDENNTVNALKNLSMAETSQPKPQRITKKRERKSAKSPVKMQKSEEVEKTHNKLLADSVKEDITSKESSESENFVELVSEYEGNDKDGQDHVTKIADCVSGQLSTFVTYNEKNDEKASQKYGTMSLQDSKENKGKVATEANSNILHNKESENTELFIQENSLATDESMAEEANKREMISGKDVTRERQSQSDDETGEETDEGEDENNSVNCIYDGIHSSRGGSNLARSIDSFENSKVATTENEKCVENELSESELSGFQFLNTCFPDMDVEVLLDVLAKKQGDVTKAVESILCHEESSSGVEKISDKQHPSFLNSAYQISPAYAVSEQDMKSFQGRDSPESQSAKQDVSPQGLNHNDHAVHDQRIFQMTLEPAVALHLLELFGPIDGVNLEGDFPTEDLIVKVDSDFGKLLYNQWRTTIQSNKEKLIFKGDAQKQSQDSEKEESCNKKSEKQNTKQQPHSSQERQHATDLRQIMDEQMALEQSRQKQEQSDNNMAVVIKRQKLYSMFPGIDPLALEELFAANRYELEPTVSMVETSCSLQAKPSEFKEVEDDLSLVAQSVDSPREQKIEYQALQDPDYADFRAEANTHYKLRDECFRKAAFAFSKKQGQLAQFYASQGHMHTEKIRQANRRAADKILEHKNSDGDQNSLDLHGLHVDEALLALTERLHFSDSSKNRPRYLSVITGKGIHSKHGKAKIKPAVLEYLRRNNYRYEELQPGLVRVSLNR